MSPQPESERLRRIFAEAALAVTPSAVPLAAIEKAGRRHRRRRTTVLSTACGLLLLPLAATTVHLASPETTTIGQPAPPTASARVVAPGERVQVAPKVSLWLTKDGKHWSTPTQADQFRSITDGNLDMSRPGVSLQSEPVDGTYLLSGVYHGKGDATTVRVVTDKGTVNGHIVTLAGNPGWGAWYATNPLPHRRLPTGPTSADGKDDLVKSVTVLDAAGRTIAALTHP
ncbi:hypothetical protein ACF064_32660 [Streptomyces sp. NPDC015492]|uniref:hypothetical protein n=1 Tax=Streptomyces sp. NPDC015492 TaxID=3364958 RepID=UPI00370102C5